MTRENQKTINTLNILSDGLVLVLSLCLAYFVRFHILRGEAGHAALSYYLASGALIAPFFLLIYGLFGLYDNTRLQNFQHEIEKLVPANLIGTVLLIAVFFLFRNVDISRLVIAFFFVISTVLEGAKRLLMRSLIRSYRANGRYLKKVVLIGSGEAAERFCSTTKNEPQLGIRVVRQVFGAPSAGGDRRDDFSGLEQILLEEIFDEAVAALSLEETAGIEEIIHACEKSGTKLSLLPFYYEHIPSHPYVDEVAGLPLMNLRRIPLDNVANALLKRLADIAGAFLLIILTAPIMLLAAAGTRLSSPGPVVFRQTRVGRNKKPFVMYKFRTMRENGREQSGWTSIDDPRRTVFGAFLRKYSIDELPQLFNVLRGDMSLVGPRPEIPHFVEQFRESIPLYMVKHQVRPGMTGWAQINGLRGDTSISDRIRHDIWYIENWSLLLDLRILLMSPIRCFSGPEKLMKPTRKKREPS